MRLNRERDRQGSGGRKLAPPVKLRAVVYRTPARIPSLQVPLRIGVLVGPQDGETVAVRAWNGARHYHHRAQLIPRACVVRDATDREQLAGVPIDPVAPPVVVLS